MKSPRSTAIKQAKKRALKVIDLARENGQLRQRCEQFEQAYNELLHHFKQLQRHRFGQRSEAYVDPNNPQSSLFDYFGCRYPGSKPDLGSIICVS